MRPRVEVDVVFTPAEIALLPARDLTRTTCVVFDILRATSSMITALAHGAAEIFPVRSIEEALALKARLPQAVLAGERHGDLIPGFEIGNAPHEYTGLAGRTIISTTTNGTQALRACDGAHRVLVGALLNLGALVGELRRAAPERVLLVCAGTGAELALEDVYAAGAVIEALGMETLADAVQIARGVRRQFPEPLAALQASRNGRVLAKMGRGKEVEWCAAISQFTVLGEMKSAVIRPLHA